jgi:hypothetical protein
MILCLIVSCSMGLGRSLDCGDSLDLDESLDFITFHYKFEVYLQLCNEILLSPNFFLCPNYFLCLNFFLSPYVKKN